MDSTTVPADTAAHPHAGAGRPGAAGKTSARRGAAAARRARSARRAASSAAPPSATSIRSRSSVPAFAQRLACCTSTHGGTRVHLIDTPGSPDFLGQSLPALDAVETAAVVINAQTGIEPMTRAHDGLGGAARAATGMIIVNKIDAAGRRPAGAAGADPGTRSARSACRSTCRPTAARASSTASSTATGDSRLLVGRRGAPRARRPGRRGRRGVVERYLEQGEVDAARAARAVRAGAARRPPDPGLLRLGAHRRRRRRAARRDRQAAAESDRGQSAAVPARARAPTAEPSCTPSPIRRSTCSRTCSRSTIDPFVGKLGVFRVHQGTVTQRHAALHRRRPQAVQGRPPVHAAGQGARRGRRAALPGDIGAVAKVDEIALRRACCTTRTPRTTTSTCSRSSSRRRCTAWRSSPSAAATSSGSADDPAQADRRGPVPARRARRRRPTRRCVCGLGELHLRIAARADGERSTSSRSTRGRRASPTARRSRRRPRATTATRSRPAAPASSARCSCASSRCRAAAGFEFVDEVKGGTIPDQFIPAVREGRARGARRRRDRRLPGAGRARHRLRRQAPPGGPKEVAFVTAGRKAFLDAIAQGAADRARADRERRDHRARAGAWATSPATCRRGAARSAAPRNGAPGTLAVRGQAPLSELIGYQARLKAHDRRPGPLHDGVQSHYEPVPPNVQPQLMSQHRRARDATDPGGAPPPSAHRRQTLASHGCCSRGRPSGR